MKPIKKTEKASERSAYPNDGDTLHPVEDEPARLREELDAERDKYLRLAAEYQNYRRRTKQEVAKAAEHGKRELLTELLTLADDLDLAVARLDDPPEAVAEGLRIVHRRFLNALEANGVIPFESEGERFDPERHEAFSVVATDEIEDGTVHEEMRRGYFWNDRLLRPALVVVAQ